MEQTLLEQQRAEEIRLQNEEERRNREQGINAPAPLQEQAILPDDNGQRAERQEIFEQAAAQARLVAAQRVENARAAQLAHQTAENEAARRSILAENRENEYRRAIQQQAAAYQLYNHSTNHNNTHKVPIDSKFGLKNLLNSAEENVREIKNSEGGEPSSSSKQNSAEPERPVTISKPRPYVYGENFDRYADRFLQYILTSQIKSSNLNLVFLQLLDDRTYDILKDIPLTREEKSDAESFVSIYKTTLCPSSRGAAMRTEIFNLRQDETESIDDFAYRLRELANKAFKNPMLKENAMLVAFAQNIADGYIKLRVLEASCENFTEAVELAKRIEGARKTIQSTNFPVLAVNKVENVRKNEERAGNEPQKVENNIGNQQESYVELRTCYKCNKQGHLANRCKEPYQNQQFRPQNGNTGYQGRNWGSSPMMQRPQNPYRQNVNQRNNGGGPYNQNSERQGGQNELPWHRSKQCWQCQQFGHIRRFCKFTGGQRPLLLTSQIPLNGQPGGNMPPGPSQ